MLLQIDRVADGTDSLPRLQSTQTAYGGSLPAD